MHPSQGVNLPRWWQKWDGDTSCAVQLFVLWDSRQCPCGLSCVSIGTSNRSNQRVWRFAGTHIRTGGDNRSLGEYTNRRTTINNNNRLSSQVQDRRDRSHTQSADKDRVNEDNKNDVLSRGAHKLLLWSHNLFYSIQICALSSVHSDRLCGNYFPLRVHVWHTK